MKVIPASSAACTTAIAAPSSGRPAIESGIPPSPIAETSSPVVPSARRCMLDSPLPPPPRQGRRLPFGLPPARDPLRPRYVEAPRLLRPHRPGALDADPGRGRDRARAIAAVLEVELARAREIELVAPAIDAERAAQAPRAIEAEV